MSALTVMRARIRKPKLLPEIPQLKFEGSAEPTVLTNQQAFHRNCGGCHDAVVKARPTLVRLRRLKEMRGVSQEDGGVAAR